MGSKENRTREASDVSNWSSQDDDWLRSHAEQDRFEIFTESLKVSYAVR